MTGASTTCWWRPPRGSATSPSRPRNSRSARPSGSYHYHEHSDNIYVVLSGTINSYVDGQSRLLSEGDVIFIPAGAAHKTTNGGDTVARALEIYAPPPGNDSHTVPDPLP